MHTVQFYENDSFLIKGLADFIGAALGGGDAGVASAPTAASAVIQQLLAFQEAGIELSLDDFGTGYSSLSYLRKFNLDFLKIDQSFVHNLEHDPDNAALCEAIIVMAHKLGLKVVAEGVENRQQSELLRRAGCDYGQGFLFGPALPADEFEALLKSAQRVPAMLQ